MPGRPDLLNLRYRLNLILEWIGDGATANAASVLVDLLDEVDRDLRAERRAAA
jgi:hypothetical protein